jgi:hypothetical protein
MSDTAHQDDEAAGKVYDARLARRLFAYARPYRALMAGALVLLLTDGLLQLAGPLLGHRRSIPRLAVSRLAPPGPPDRSRRR